MKIIATTGSHSFLAEITAEEIDHLAGKRIGENAGGYYQNQRREIQPGTVFSITKVFEQIHRNDQRKSQIATLRQTLNMMLTGLDMIDPLIEEPKTEETPAEVR